MTSIESLYCLDTSALFYLEDTYSIETFPDVWEQLSQLVSDKSLIAPKEVLRELEKKTDNGALSWTKKNRELLRELDATQSDIARSIINSPPFYELIDFDSEFPDADPFVVALAVISQIETGLFNDSPAVVAVRESGILVSLEEVCESDLYPIRFLTPYQMLEEIGIDTPIPGGTGLSDIYGIWAGLEFTEDEIADSKVNTWSIEI